jgi:hypothetical protein
MYTSARVAKPGQRRQVQGLISQEFLGSNPIPRIFYDLLICSNGFRRIISQYSRNTVESHFKFVFDP